ncbi:hypothetical protein NS220_03745 [Microbacterium testaceum]|uniref:Uncharacterized protein n=1 Tax=Microbacterium testaceum TaxID=2033 RepID=A0A147F0B9_MICTE|nr:hypothetical protein [Microbacterium testaceum]KTR96066.1 hypothetical protein NS220_03745 [Microbacterium testaceum]
MSDTPFEPSRRSRREARAAVDSPTPEQTFRLDDETEPDKEPRPSRSAADTDPAPRPSPRASNGFFGTWKPLVAAAAAIVVAVIVGLIVTVAFNGAAGRSIGSVLASVVVGGTGIGLMARTRPAGFFRVNGLDVLWGLILGAVMPFIAGIGAVSRGWPAFEALSLRWLVLGVAAPFVIVLMLTFFAIGFVYPAALSYTSTRFTPTVARIVSGAVSAVAFAIIPIVFAGNVSGMPFALPVGLGIAASVFVALSRRFWGPLLMGLVFTGVWVMLAIAGYILA